MLLKLGAIQLCVVSWTTQNSIAPSYKNSRRNRRFPASQEGCRRTPKNSQYRLAALERFRRKMFREPLATRIVKEGAAILQKQDSERERTIKGRRMLTFTFLCEVEGDLTDRIMEKFDLRYVYTYKLSYKYRDRENEGSPHIPIRQPKNGWDNKSQCLDNQARQNPPHPGQPKVCSHYSL